MNKNIIYLLLMGFIIKSKTEYAFEIIEELIPKRILFDNLEISPFKILKYSPLCEENISSKTANIYFQYYFFNDETFYLYLYDNFSEIKQDEYGKFSISKYIGPFVGGGQLFRNLTCKRDYYFIILYSSNNKIITTNELKTKYFEILILKEETNINLSPLLSDHYRIYSRKKEDSLFFSFNCTMFAYLGGNYIIKENEKNIIDVRYRKDIYEFKKDKKYNITFSSEIIIYFYVQSQFIKFDINKFPIIIYPEFTRIKKYILEIDISNYELDEYILLRYDGDIFLNLKYQFKNELKNNNFIDLGTYGYNYNYIPIKKSKKDSFLLLYIRQIEYPGDDISLINISKFKVCEITSDFNNNFEGPKLFFIDYYKFNNLKSFGIESDHEYFFLEQTFQTSYIKTTSSSYENLTITLVNNDDSYIYKRAFIIFNTTDIINLKVKKFDYSIFNIGHAERYFQICQADVNHKEFYFNIYGNEIFKPIFGNYDSFFISYSKIKTLSDFDFNKIKETNFFQSSDERGFLKIKCQNPAMVSQEYLIGIEPRNLTSGKRYILEKKFASKNSLYLDEKLINKNIPLKFSLFGIKTNSSIELILDNKTYIINSSQPLEIEYFFEKNNNGSMNFKFEENIENSLKIEINIGFIKEDLDSYKQIDFIDSFGKLEIEPKKGIFIKIPKNLNENLYEYSIILPYNRNDKNIYDVQISYDKIEFMVPRFECFSSNYPSYFRIIPLFNTNPYIYISKEDEKSQNKLFYISIFNNMIINMKIFIQKPKVLSEIKLNILNKLPPLNGEEQKYYYKIYFPKGDYNSLLVQDVNENYKSFSKNVNIYSLDNFYQNYQIILLVDKNDIMNNNSYLNYYNTNPSDSYLKFIPNNESIYSDMVYNELRIRNKMNISQIEGKNKLKITINSYSYYLEQPFKYYLFINAPNDLVYIYSIINKFKNLEQNQIMMILDDNGEKEIFEYEFEINDNLYEGKNTSLENKAFFVPSTKEGILAYTDLDYNCYYFKYIKYNNKSNTIAIDIFIVIGVLIIIIIIALLYLRRRKKMNNDLNLKILDYINSIE